jgi:DNA gyrase/topoisomerase IV subunit A
MPVVVPPKKVEKNVVDIPKNESKNESKNNSVWAPKPKLVYKQPSPEEIQELQMKRLAELEEQRQEAEANKLADELEEIINEGIKDVKEVEPELVLRVSESGYMSALEMAMKSGRTNVRVEIV